MNTLGVSEVESIGKDNIKVDHPFFVEKVMKLLLESSFEAFPESGRKNSAREV